MLSLHEVLQVLRNTVKFETYHYSMKFPGLSGTKSFSRTFQSFEATTTYYYYTVSQKKVPPLACYNFDTHEWILIFFGRNVTDK